MAEEAVYIRGLDKLRADLRRVDPKLTRLIGKAHKRVAEELIAAPARAAASSLGRGQVHLARSGVISPRGTSTYAAVRLNAAGAYRDAFAQEFGRNQAAGFMRTPNHTRDTHGQFRPWRGNANEWTWEGGTGGAGYALFPTFRRNRQRIVDEYENKMLESFKEAFPE